MYSATVSEWGIVKITNFHKNITALYCGGIAIPSSDQDVVFSCASMWGTRHEPSSCWPDPGLTRDMGPGLSTSILKSIQLQNRPLVMYVELAHYSPGSTSYK